MSNQILSSSVTYNSIYNLPWRYCIEIWNADESTLNYVSDGFDQNNSSFNVTQINVEQAQWESWRSSIKIDDSVYNSLNPERIDNGTILKISLGKTSTALQDVFYGISILLDRIVSNLEF